MGRGRNTIRVFYMLSALSHLTTLSAYSQEKHAPVNPIGIHATTKPTSATQGVANVVEANLLSDYLTNGAERLEHFEKVLAESSRASEWLKTKAGLLCIDGKLTSIAPTLISFMAQHPDKREDFVKTNPVPPALLRQINFAHGATSEHLDDLAFQYPYTEEAKNALAQLINRFIDRAEFPLASLYAHYLMDTYPDVIEQPGFQIMFFQAFAYAGETEQAENSISKYRKSPPGKNLKPEIESRIAHLISISKRPKKKEGFEVAFDTEFPRNFYLRAMRLLGSTRVLKQIGASEAAQTHACSLIEHHVRVQQMYAQLMEAGVLENKREYPKLGKPPMLEELKKGVSLFSSLGKFQNEGNPLGPLSLPENVQGDLPLELARVAAPVHLASHLAREEEQGFPSSFGAQALPWEMELVKAEIGKKKPASYKLRKIMRSSGQRAADAVSGLLFGAKDDEVFPILDTLEGLGDSLVGAIEPLSLYLDGHTDIDLDRLGAISKVFRNLERRPNANFYDQNGVILKGAATSHFNALKRAIDRYSGTEENEKKLAQIGQNFAHSLYLWEGAGVYFTELAKRNPSSSLDTVVALSLLPRPSSHVAPNVENFVLHSLESPHRQVRVMALDFLAQRFGLASPSVASVLARLEKLSLGIDSETAVAAIRLMDRFLVSDQTSEAEKNRVFRFLAEALLHGFPPAHVSDKDWTMRRIAAGDVYFHPPPFVTIASGWSPVFLQGELVQARLGNLKDALDSADPAVRRAARAEWIFGPVYSLRAVSSDKLRNQVDSLVRRAAHQKDGTLNKDILRGSRYFSTYAAPVLLELAEKALKGKELEAIQTVLENLWKNRNVLEAVPPSMVTALEHLLSHSDSKIRVSAFAFLAFRHIPSTAAALADAVLEESDEDVKQEKFRALYSSVWENSADAAYWNELGKSEKLVAALESMVQKSSSSPKDIHLARGILDKIRPWTEQEAIRALSHKGAISGMAVTFLSRDSTDPEKLLPLLISDSNDLRTNAMTVLLNLEVEGLIRDHWQSTQGDIEKRKKLFLAFSRPDVSSSQFLTAIQWEGVRDTRLPSEDRARTVSKFKILPDTVLSSYDFLKSVAMHTQDSADVRTAAIQRIRDLELLPQTVSKFLHPLQKDANNEVKLVARSELWDLRAGLEKSEREKIEADVRADLKSSDVRTQLTSAVALVETEPETVRSLIPDFHRMLKDPDAELRSGAVWLLLNFDKEDGAAIEAAKAILSGEDMNSRILVLDAITRLKIKDRSFIPLIEKFVPKEGVSLTEMPEDDKQWVLRFLGHTALQDLKSE